MSERDSLMNAPGVMPRPEQIPYDLLSHNKTRELILCPPWKSAEIVGVMLEWSIVGINLPHDTVKTPFGVIGAVLE